MSNLNLALIGNSTVSALINPRADIVWSCMPRPDSTPVFDGLLRQLDGDPTGRFRSELLDFSHAEQSYLKNAAILVTRLIAHGGAAIEIIDFAPRFKQYGRVYRPVMLMRQIRLCSGMPRVRIQIRPQACTGYEPVTTTYGSNHIRYLMPALTLRLTTDLSLTAIQDETPVVIDDTVTLILGPDESWADAVTPTGQHFYDQTADYWTEWVPYLGIPFEWQREVIRAAITLKLNANGDTGAIIAAVTTSIPEAPASGRNWDYRYCWLRDAYFVVAALNRLGATLTMEHYLRYIINRVADSTAGLLQPVYRINGHFHIEESIVEELPGYRGMGPVRIGNAAYTQVQNDVYGAAVLAAAHMFYDERLRHPGTEHLFSQLEVLGDRVVEAYAQPDAGPWEYRGIRKVHTFSAVMCWAACDRLAKIASRLHLDQRCQWWCTHADALRADILAHTWNADLNCFVASFDGSQLDASLLLLHQLGFVAADDPRFIATVTAIEKHLKHGDFIMRYVENDDFGAPETAFTVCTFWFVDALHAIGRRAEARDLFSRLLQHCNPHGLLSEDIDVRTGELWGNFPQTYSMVGLINSALRLSVPWEGNF
ncbi:MAG: glycoside hydrolase family 15 protein [Porticoccaceae bacterium]